MGADRSSLNNSDASDSNPTRFAGGWFCPPAIIQTGRGSAARLIRSGSASFLLASSETSPPQGNAPARASTPRRARPVSVTPHPHDELEKPRPNSSCSCMNLKRAIRLTLAALSFAVTLTASTAPGITNNAYLFTSFRGNGDGLHLAYSFDARKWKDLNHVFLPADRWRQVDARSAHPAPGRTGFITWSGRAVGMTKASVTPVRKICARGRSNAFCP
jgi:hypothetical protein